MFFNLLKRGVNPPSSGQNEIYLSIDFWNDYDFVTMFYVRAFDGNGNLHDLGNVTIRKIIARIIRTVESSKAANLVDQICNN